MRTTRPLISMLIWMAAGMACDADDARVANGQVELAPGDDFWVSLKQEGAVLTPQGTSATRPKGQKAVRLRLILNFADKPIKPAVTDKVVEFMLSEFKEMTVLVIQKNFPGKVVYECAAQKEGAKEFAVARNLPLENELPMFEQYPTRLAKLLLSKFRIEESQRKK